MQLTRALSVFLLLGAFLAGCGHLIYTSGPYRGRVVDAETQQPLAGAAVLAVWRWEGPGLGHPSEGFHDALEVLTDANGEFMIPRKTHFIIFGQIDEPDITIYSPGYGPFPGYQVQPKGPALDSAFREHTVVELRRFKTYKERGEWAGIPSGAVGVPDEKMPNLIHLVNQERRALGWPPIHTEKAK